MSCPVAGVLTAKTIAVRFSGPDLIQRFLNHLEAGLGGWRGGRQDPRGRGFPRGFD